MMICQDRLGTNIQTYTLEVAKLTIDVVCCRPIVVELRNIVVLPYAA